MIGDTASASTVAVILLLASCVAAAAILAGVVYPIYLHDAEEQEMQAALSAITDTRRIMDRVAASPYTGIAITSPLPGGSLAAEECGTLYFNDEPIRISRLVLTTDAGSVGISANGVWRADAGGAGWNLFPQYLQNETCLILEVLRFENNLSVASSDMIPYRFVYLGSETHTVSGKNATLRFVSNDETESRLWQTYFQELVFLLDSMSKQKCKIAGSRNGDTLTLTAKLYTITIQVIEHQFNVYAGDP